MIKSLRKRLWLLAVPLLPLLSVAAIGLSFFFFPGAVHAQTTFFGPTPYLSTADIPAGFYASGLPAVLEDCEDGSLDPAITADGGFCLGPLGPVDLPGAVDSVDADDGVIDGSGLDGHSYHIIDASPGLTFTFSPPVVAAGVVLTDAFGDYEVEAFGPGMVSLGTSPSISFPLFEFGGQTAEDRFVGVQDPGGIVAIRIKRTPNSVKVGGLEVDHIQFGAVAVQIDIKPGSDPNCFNNDGNGVIPVAILGSVSFNVTEIDAATVQLEGMAVKAVGKSNKLLASIEDVNGDLIDDLVVKIEDEDGIFSAGDTTAIVSGNLLPAFGSKAFQGTDTICIVGPAAPRLNSQSKLTTTWARMKAKR